MSDQVRGKQLIDGEITEAKLAPALETTLIRTDGSQAFASDQSAGGNKITNLGAPTNPNDAARLADITAADGSAPVVYNKDMTAEVTTGVGDKACDEAIAATPATQSFVRVLINKVAISVGDGCKTRTCYFSDDGGTTAKLIGDIAAGDKLYWGSGAPYQLDANDTVDFDYNSTESASSSSSAGA